MTQSLGAVVRVGLATLVGLIAVSGVAAGGGGSVPGVTFGSPGVMAPAGNVRYLALPSAGRTIVAVQGVGTGALGSWRSINHELGVPTVAFDGTTDGVSGDGKTLVLASQPQVGTKAVTRFVVLRLPSLRVRNVIELDGLWAFDAISPTGATIVAAKYASTDPGVVPRYEVYAINARTGRVYPAPIVDKRDPDEAMNGYPNARAYSPTRAWAYTLYVRPSGRGFIHALDTVHRSARCIDLPWGGLGSAPNLRLLSRPGLRELQVLQGSTLLARVNLDTLRVKVVNRPTLG